MPDDAALAPPPAASAEAAELAFAVFTEIGKVNQLATALLEAALPHGMVAAQWGVLNHLSNRPAGRTPLQLAQAFQVPKTSMTHSVAVLERLGFVETAPNPEDGRSKIVRATPAGLAFRARTVATLAPAMAQALAALDPGTFAALLPPLRHLRAVLDAAREG